MDDLPLPPACLAVIERDTNAAGFAMPSEHRTGALLRLLAASRPGGRMLELGTGTGLGTAWLLDGMDRAAHLTSVDPDAAVQAIARRHLGDDPRLNLVTGPAEDWLPRASPGSFDLIFADALVGKYERFDEAFRLLRIGGLYVADDMLPQTNWPDGHGQRVAALLVALDGRADARVVRLAWASGLVLVVRTDP
ncbi:MAG: class I SAM-dependent methyltransferase [Alphaproteobacteria bacterium]